MKIISPSTSLISRSLVCLIVIIFYFSTYQAFSQDNEEELEVYDEWRLKKDKDGIKILTRWIKAEEGRKARQMHAVMQVKSTLGAGIMALTNDQQVKIWLNRAKEYYHFDREDDYHWYAYTQFKIPWPLDNQDLITYNTLQQDNESKNIHVALIGDPGHKPEEKGVQRIPHFDGSWEFKPLENGLIQIDYYIFTKTKPVLPRWIIDPIVEYGLWSTFRDMREIILENNSKNIKLSFISD